MNGFKERSSYGTLYTKSCGCSKGGFVDKFVRDANKTLDSSQRSPHDCLKCGNQDPGENSAQSPPHIDHHCCYGCGDSLDGIFCQQCTYESCGNGAHYGYNCPPKVLIISNSEPCHNQNVDEFPQTLPSFHRTCYSRDENSFAYDSTPNFFNDSPNVFNPTSQPLNVLMSFVGTILNLFMIVHLKFRLSIIQNRVTIKTLISHKIFKVFNNNILVVKAVGARIKLFNKIPIYYDNDDDEESSTFLRYIIISELPLCIAITPVVSTKQTKDSLIMGDDHLDTISEKESNEFIKSSVENLVPNPSEFEDLSNIGRECDVPVCDDFTTFSNLLFDADDNFSFSNDKSFFYEDVAKEIYSNPIFDEEIISMKIDPHHFNADSDRIESLLNQDYSIISSSKIDSLLDEFTGELIFLKSIPQEIDEADCDTEEEIRLIKKLLYDNSSSRPPEEFNSKNSDARLFHCFVFCCMSRIVQILKTRARGFVLRSLDLHILSLILGIQYLNLIDERLSLCILNKRP
nr:hypothetical protein [Tanacetum cinerariifolium]